VEEDEEMHPQRELRTKPRISVRTKNVLLIIKLLFIIY